MLPTSRATLKCTLSGGVSVVAQLRPRHNWKHTIACDRYIRHLCRKVWRTTGSRKVDLMWDGLLRPGPQAKKRKT